MTTRHLGLLPRIRRGAMAAGLVAGLAWVTSCAAESPHRSEVQASSARSSPSGRAAAVDLAPVRGIVISTPRAGGDWATPVMRETMAEAAELGVTWVATHPYARVSRETGEVRWRADAVDHVTRPVAWAEELGLRIAIKPHLAYWGEFAWRGEIGWEPGAEEWKTFRRTYRAWIHHLARLAAESGADLFVVGTELRRTEAMADWWRSLALEIRGIYPGPLTYAANWDDYHRVEFWDALDLIGVQAYFPLTEDPDPDLLSLRQAWEAPLAQMRRLAQRWDRPILWTEIGYSNAPDAAARPWESSRRRGANPLQERLLRAALETASEEPAVAGLFLWKWFPSRRPLGSYDFLVQSARHKALLGELWGGRENGVRDEDRPPPADPGRAPR